MKKFQVIRVTQHLFGLPSSETVEVTFNKLWKAKLYKWWHLSNAETMWRMNQTLKIKEV